MRSKVWAVIGSLVLGGLVFATPRAYAKCDATGADAGDIANARAQVALNCNCAGSTNHGAFVKCATQQAKTNLTNQSCMGQVVRCAARSTCGKPNFVTCCRTSATGQTRCSTKSGADQVQGAEGRHGVRRARHPQLLRCLLSDRLQCVAERSVPRRPLGREQPRGPLGPPRRGGTDRYERS